MRRTISKRVERKQQQTRARLLHVALGLFHEEGIYWTKIEDITERADIGKGTFYKYLPTKEAVLLALLQHGLEELSAQIRERTRSGLDESQIIEQVIDAQFDFYLQRPEYLLLFHQVKPHRLERYIASDDPDFERKAADIIGLYMNPPQHAAIFCVDEKTAIQALDRLDPVRPLSPGRVERHGFEYFRHGTLSLYAAFNTQTGEVLGKTAERHTSAEFVALLTDLLAHHPHHREVHVILDTLSAHKTKHVETFLQAHPHVRLHFTPTYSSWLNQVELWFAKIERAVIARGIFTSRHDLNANSCATFGTPTGKPPR